MRVGVIIYGRNANLPIRLDYTGNDQTDTLRAIDELRLPSTGNNLKQALQLAKTYIFSTIYGGRPGVPKTLIVFNNKPVETDAFDVAKELLEKGYTIASVAVGDDIRADDGTKLSGRQDLALTVESVSQVLPAAQVLSQLLRPGKAVCCLR